ncbi:hypothetical protein [Dactylosporangium fulvum]|uniref:N-acetyltransferase domain-containing protein n=1 Tax=Dactylosporangium fulvum TaxID=53359 RepID=A0ABY5W546_9ACTN|nr:hypothetical protein [Dactylosporangium fulvum]UWP84500.1 hypothetical protein Dfulv_09810 [Dactylosporangium fulvum]
MSALMLIRRLPPGREAVARRVVAEWKDEPAWQGVADGGSVEWWELVDPAGDDDQPAAGLAAVQTAGATAHLVYFATPPGHRDRAAQLLIALVDALRATPARRLVAAPPAAGRDIPDVLRLAGFQPLPDGQEAVDL